MKLQSIPLYRAITMTLMWTVLTYAQYSGGSGTPADPYQLWTAQDLGKLSKSPADWGAHFELMQDIDMSGLGSDPLETTIGYFHNDYDQRAFTGVFDGNDHQISNLRVIQPSLNVLGLFGYINDPNAVIRHLTLVNPIIQGNSGIAVGALAGRLDDGLVQNCGVLNGSISGQKNTGGLIGLNAGRVESCFSATAVQAASGAGGLIGSCQGSGLLYNCYSTADVNAIQQAAGLAATNEGTIIHCYADGLVSAPTAGGLIASNIGAVRGCYWDTDISGQTASAAGEGKTSAQLMTAATFIDWGSCPSTWVIQEGQSHPTLAWQGLDGSFLEAPTLNDHLAGQGSADDPYLIESTYQFNWIGSYPCDWDRHFKLIKDLDLSDLDANSINLIARFSGVFDGNDHTIANFTYHKQNVGSVALFRYLTGRIENLTLSQPRIDTLPNGSNAGTLVGRMAGGSLHHCRVVAGSVSGDNAIGGLVGRQDAGVIIDCEATATIRASSKGGALIGYSNGRIEASFSDGQVSPGATLGGLAGMVYTHGTVSRCCSYASVNGNTSIGGLVGSNYGLLANVYATGQTQGNQYAGGLIGSNNGSVTHGYSSNAVLGNYYTGGLIGQDNNGVYSGCFYNTTLNPQRPGIGAPNDTTAVEDPQIAGWPLTALQHESTFLPAGWDFIDETANGTADIWKIYESHDTPRLNWENDRPIAVAGPNQVLHADANQIATAHLDGSASYDINGDPLTYQWSWTIDGQAYEANSITVDLTLHPGTYPVTLTVNDGHKTSAASSLTIQVVTPTEVPIMTLPSVISRINGLSDILVFIHRPRQAHLTEPPRLHIGSLIFYPIRVDDNGSATALAYYNKAKILSQVGDGPITLTIEGLLSDGSTAVGQQQVQVTSDHGPNAYDIATWRVAYYQTACQ